MLTKLGYSFRVYAAQARLRCQRTVDRAVVGKGLLGRVVRSAGYNSKGIPGRLGKAMGLPPLYLVMGGLSKAQLDAQMGQITSNALETLLKAASDNRERTHLFVMFADHPQIFDALGPMIREKTLYPVLAELPEATFIQLCINACCGDASSAKDAVLSTGGDYLIARGYDDAMGKLIALSEALPVKFTDLIAKSGIELVVAHALMSDQMTSERAEAIINNIHDHDPEMHARLIVQMQEIQAGVENPA